jgi:regulator of RNase E activity RraA
MISAPIKNYVPDKLLVGPAYPVIVRNSILPVLQALDETPANYVLVISDVAESKVALLGEIIATAARQQQLGGIVCFGAIRDVDQIREIGIPVWAQGACPDAAPLGEPISSLPESLEVNGCLVRRGDWLFGDEDGLVCVEQEWARHVIKAAQIKAKRESLFVDRLECGERLSDMMNLEGFLHRGEDIVVEF